MDRAELALLLGAPHGLVAEPRPEATVIAEAEAVRFMAAFAAATAQGGVVMLAGDSWGEHERRQLDALRHQVQITPATAAGKGWLCIPTGGTGGVLKFARHDEATLAAAVRGFTQHFGLERVNAAGVLPLHHVSGLMAWLRCALTGGEYLPLDWKEIEAGVLPVRPDKPDGWVISLVPTQLERLLHSARAVEWLAKFRLVLLGGGPVWPALLDQAAAHRLPVSLGYGMTESAAMLTALRPEEFLAGARSSGAVLPHATVKIGAGDAIIIGGDSLFRGYHPQWRDRWDFETQDYGRLDGQGHLHVTGRRDALIITGGEKVEPAEVEAVLRSSGEFSEVVVLGLPDTKWGQQVVAVYPGSARPNFHKVIEVMSRLAVPKRPKRYIPLVGPWPANAQGKVNRPTLLEQVIRQSKERR